MSNSNELDTFIALSKVLTGEDEIDGVLAGEYLERLKKDYPMQIQGILDAFSQIGASTSSPASAVFEIKNRILDNKNLQQAARQVINIWYTAEFVGADGKSARGGTQAQYYRGLLWKVIQAHAPTYSTDVYGYWQRPPK